MKGIVNRPNILVITTDQQSHHMMSCAGNQWLRTPNMDRVAAWGTRLERGYCSDPVCVPARYSWWTGRMPSSIGMRSNHGPLERAPQEVHDGGLGHLMRAADYEVLFGGKVHTPSKIDAETLGFDYFQRDERDRLAVDAAARIRGKHDRPWFMAVNFINPHDICYQAIRAFADEGFDRMLLKQGEVEIGELDEALQLPSGIDEKTFFAEYCPPLPDNHAVPADEPRAIQSIVEQRSFRKRARAQWGEREWRLHRWAYHRLTERVDDQIGVVLDALEISGQLDETVIVLASDHGDHGASHRLEHKATFYDEATRVPLLVARPGNGVAEACDRRWISNIGLDLMATCCDYAGIEQPDYNRGTSLRPVIEGDAGAEPPAGAYGEGEIGFMWVSQDWKYCRYDAAGDEEEALYDLRNDPGEMRNVAGESDKRGIVAGHRAALDSAMAEHEALRVDECKMG